FAHMPLMMGADGAKLSKRHGAVSVEEYKKEGFLPEALVNYLLLLGWSPGEDSELVTLSEAAKRFELTDVKDVQARFDARKLRWLNGEYIAKKETKELFPLIKARLALDGLDTSEVSDDHLMKIIALYKIRIKTIKEFVELADYFFTEDFVVEEKGERKYLSKEENRKNIKLFAEKLEAPVDFTHENIETICREIAEKNNLKAAQIIHPARMAISGKTRGAGLFETMELLGKEIVIDRMKKAAEKK
ncbi:MAG: glutamate--tRNA ligase, partial [Candidatus Omnitrophica bacterium]|nr:glutamate--tRNA ligase [Candidatus Omnitrophota bacterium]